MVEAPGWDARRAREIIAEFSGVEGAMLPILHALQGEFGYVAEDATPVIAEALNLSRAEVHGVISFYHDFRHAPAGRHSLKLCRGEACQSMGSEALAQKFLAGRSLGWHETSADGSLTVDPVYCLGLCSSSPAALLDGEPIARLDLASLDEAVDEALAEAQA
ncbi:formate dehydrogenase subunit gamma [Methylocapsa palsarum]|uniref:Formate dehydrogenase subunit gamma n=1 Tax=Methylocapsa palsarum TaxID=1612308 RepID=A0A1I3W9W7_9HYPH|nr:formate dehydrogenase subunit gamma [Methylocapsa palsarum]SFK03993.1 formate dehydrogenase subunit gamma [Methylocapsa palsarum]